MKKLQATATDLIVIFSGFLNIYMTFMVLFPLLNLFALFPSVLVNTIVYNMAVEKVREILPFQTENARNWALVRGDSLFDYLLNWKVFTAVITTMLFLVVNFSLYLIFV